MKIFSQFCLLMILLCPHCVKSLSPDFITFFNIIHTAGLPHQQAWDFGTTLLFWWLLVEECWTKTLGNTAVTERVEAVASMLPNIYIWENSNFECSDDQFLNVWLKYDFSLLKSSAVGLRTGWIDSYLHVTCAADCLYMQLCLSGCLHKSVKVSCWLNLNLNCECSLPSGPPQTPLH